MVKKLSILLLFVASIITVLIISCNFHQKHNSNLEDKKTQEYKREDYNITEYDLMDLNYESLDLSNKSLYTHRTDDTSLYLSTIDLSKSDLGKTLNIVIYNFNDKKTEIIEYRDNKRIVDYVIKNNHIYFVTIEYENDLLKWTLNKSDKSFDNKKILNQGIINSPFIAPSFYIYNNQFYFISFDLNNGNEKYDISRIDDNNIVSILEIDGKKEQLLDLEKVFIDNSSIYYICYSDNAQNVKRYDFNSKKSEKIYSTNTKGDQVFEIGILDDYVVVNNINNDKSTLIYVNKKGETEKIELSTSLSFMRALDGNKIIMHDDKKIFSLISKNENKIMTFTFDDLDLYPKYAVFNSELLVLRNYGDKYYTYSLKNNELNQK